MPSRLNVLEVIPTLDRSGAEKQMTLLATHLDPARFRVHVCALTRGGPYAEAIRQAGLPLAILGKSRRFDPLVVRRLSRLMTAWRIDLVHTWLFAGNCYGRVAARRAGVPVVIAAERCVDQWKAAWQLALDRHLARWTDALVVNSPGVAAFYARAGIEPARIHVIPNGLELGPSPAVDVPALRRSLGLPTEAVVFGSIGRLWPQKRVETAIVAVGILQEAGVEAHLLVVGDGPQRTRLQHLVDDLQMARTVHFLGPRDDVPILLEAIDVLLLASAFEGMPNVVMEAMAAARPVVATDIPGPRDLVVDGQTGFLVPLAQGARGLAAAALRLADDPALRQRLGQAGRERLQRHFSVDQMVRAHAELYLALARAKGLTG